MTETNDDVAEKLKEAAEKTEKVRKEGTEKLSKGRPTPTQEENDRAALGEHILEHEDDGSGPDPHAQQSEKPAASHATRTRHAEARPSSGAGYSTRQATPGSSS